MPSFLITKTMVSSTAVGNPIGSNSLAQSPVGPGGLAGSAFTTDTGTDGGPGGLAGGSFYAGTDSSRPGGFGGNHWYIIAKNLRPFWLLKSFLTSIASASN